MELVVTCIIVYPDGKTQMVDVDVNILFGLPEPTSIIDYVIGNHPGAKHVYIAHVGTVIAKKG